MLDGTVDPKDTSGENQDPSKEKQGTSEPKTYQEADVQKIVNDRLAAAGRDAKAIEAKTADLKAREEAVALHEKEKDEEAYEKVRGNPDALSKFEADKQIRAEKKALADEKDAFEKTKLEHQIAVEAANTLSKEQGIIALSTKYKVDATVLKDLDLDLEHTEKVAQRLTTLSPEQLGVKQPAVPKKRDSGVTIGSGGNLTGLSPKEKLKEIDRQLREK